MKKIIICALLTMLYSAATHASAYVNLNEIVGKWRYELPDAPEGYQNGIIDITVKNDTLLGEIHFSEENRVSLKDIVYEENTLTCGVYVEYEYIKVKIVIKGNKMEGAVNTPDGVMVFTASKII
ncbi:MAG: hypothetical protein PHH93_01220 [Prolixibacteraceae bacterium]|nr:hypothetical protein [Prolixibacteraceae bacterium]